VKMILTDATNPTEYLAVLEAGPHLEERLKWGHLVFFLAKEPVLLIRSEPLRVLFGFWQGKSLRHIEPRLKPGGKYQMATLELREGTPLDRAVVLELVKQACRMGESTARIDGSQAGQRGVA
jgi:hypothetical protein